MLIKEISILTAFWGGFSSFFSIWQLCLMQMTPFFLTFAVGIYLLATRPTLTLHPLPEGEGRALVNLILACAGYILGFSIVFALMGTSGWGASRYIIYNLESFRTVAAVYLTAVSLTMTGRVAGKLRISHSALRIALFPIGLLLGASFAISYSPCIPPVMSDIMNFASKPANAHEGFHLLVVYGFGLTSAFAFTGIAVSMIMGRLALRDTVQKVMIYMSSAALLIMAVLIVTDLMISYKSLLVGLALD